MEKKQFLGEFSLLDYNISHKVLLFRKSSNTEENQNIDLVFEGTFYLEVPTKLKNIIVYQADEETTNKVIKRYGGMFYPEYSQVIFVIESGTALYYIGCIRLLITENSLNLLTSSIK